MRYLAVILALMTIPLGAQTPPPPVPLVSPEVLADRRVTFRCRAPNAREVLLALEGAGRVPMVRNEQGVWSVTTDGLEPDYYGYSFIVDGVALVDPMNALMKASLLNAENMVHVPGPASLPWEANQVPHGTLHHHFYRSRVVGDERDFFVYTPPGYDPRANRQYPVLYLQHGYTGDARGWSVNGRVNVMLDNLIGEGKAKPMMAVMSLSYGAPEMVRRSGPDLTLLKQNYDRFRDALLTEVIPEVEKTYRVSKDADSRAIAGVSMGGTEALFVGLNATKTFGWIGSFSAGGMPDDLDATFPTAGSKENARARLLWIACGTEDPLIGPNRALREWLAAKGVPFVPIETPGKHTWMVWRRNFAAFAQLLFR